MKLNDLVKRFIFIGASTYTAISLILLLVFFVATGGGTHEGGGAVTIIEPSRQLLIMLFSFCFALATTVCTLPSIPFYLKAVIHSVMTIGSFFSCVVMPAGMDGEGNLIITVIFALLYAIMFISVTLTVRALNRKNAIKSAKPAQNSAKKPTQTEAKKSGNKKRAEYKNLFSDKE